MIKDELQDLLNQTYPNEVIFKDKHPIHFKQIMKSGRVVLNSEDYSRLKRAYCLYRLSKDTYSDYLLLTSQDELDRYIQFQQSCKSRAS